MTSNIPMLFTMSGCQYWTSTPHYSDATSYWYCNSVYSTTSLASTAAAGISVASTYACKTKTDPAMSVAGSMNTYNILPYFMIAADDEFIDG